VRVSTCEGAGYFDGVACMLPPRTLLPREQDRRGGRPTGGGAHAPPRGRVFEVASILVGMVLGLLGFVDDDRAGCVPPITPDFRAKPLWLWPCAVGWWSRLMCVCVTLCMYGAFYVVVCVSVCVSVCVVGLGRALLYVLLGPTDECVYM